ncbi:MAG: hypothetical protein HC869_23165, partial [Rhodospirillales bacterium]|nr:hypothetical protein [Rhodospirillales bacterium]
MQSVKIDRRFCGPPNSGNGGYVCGLLASHIDGSAEITLCAPPPLEQQLDIAEGTDGAVELREAEAVIAIGRPVELDISEIPAATFAEAEEAARRTPYDESNHKLPTCFVCGPARAHGDGLRIFAGALHPERTPAPLPPHGYPTPNL